MKLLYLHHKPVTQNAANNIQVLNMCFWLASVGFEVTLILPKEKNITEIKHIQLIEEKLSAKINFKVQTFQERSILGKMSIYFALFYFRSINISKYDYIFTRHPLVNILFHSQKNRIIFEIHNNNFYKIMLINNLFVSLIVWSSKNNILIITISSALKNYWIKKGMNKRKILALHDGFSTYEFQNLLDQGILRRKLNIPKNEIVISYAGSLYKDRNIEYIINLAKDFRDCRFFIIGGPDKEMTYYKNVCENQNINNVMFTGYLNRSKMIDYLFLSDILLMIWSWNVPTIKICSPLKVFEYMATAKLIVGQKFPTIEEVLTDNETALLAEPDNYSDIKQKLSRALSIYSDQSMGKLARELAFSKYSWEKRCQIIKKYIEEKNEVIKKN